jgi:hypothetical protein
MNSIESELNSSGFSNRFVGIAIIVVGISGALGYFIGAYLL